MTPAAPFGPRDFQLVLLRRMADHQPGLVEDARHHWAPRSPRCARPTAAGRRWSARPAAAARWPATARCSASPSRSYAAGSAIWSATRCCGRVPLWPDLRFEVLAAPAGRCGTSGWSARPGRRAPSLPTAEDLQPWSCTVDEVGEGLPARTADGGLGPDAVAAGADASGRGAVRGGVHLGTAPRLGRPDGPGPPRRTDVAVVPPRPPTGSPSARTARAIARCEQGGPGRRRRRAVRRGPR